VERKRERKRERGTERKKSTTKIKKKVDVDSFRDGYPNHENVVHATSRSIILLLQ
jgi:hypothetical protein